MSNSDIIPRIFMEKALTVFAESQCDNFDDFTSEMMFGTRFDYLPEVKKLRDEIAKHEALLHPVSWTAPTSENKELSIGNLDASITIYDDWGRDLHDAQLADQYASQIAVVDEDADFAAAFALQEKEQQAFRDMTLAHHLKNEDEKLHSVPPSSRQSESMIERDARMARELAEEEKVNELKRRFGSRAASREMDLVDAFDRIALEEADAALAREMAGEMEAKRVQAQEDGKIHTDILVRRMQDAEQIRISEAKFDNPERITLKDGTHGSGYYYKCPHCKGCIFTAAGEVNCTIFTHGVTEQGQVNQHLRPEQAAALVKSGAVRAGCMLQYQLIQIAGGYSAVPCIGK